MGNIFGSLFGDDDKPAYRSTSTTSSYPSYSYRTTEIPSYRTSYSTTNTTSYPRTNTTSYSTTATTSSLRKYTNSIASVRSSYSTTPSTVIERSSYPFDDPVISSRRTRTTGYNSQKKTPKSDNSDNGQYYPSHDVKLASKNNFTNLPKGSRLSILINELKSNSNQFTETNYLEALRLFVDIEDLYCEEAIKVNNCTSCEIEYFDTIKTTREIRECNIKKTIKVLQYIYKVKIPNLQDSRPTISVGNRLIFSSNIDSKYGTIFDIQPDYIKVEFKDTMDTDLIYNVEFLSNRTTFRMEKLAIKLMKDKNLIPFMFPSNTKIHTSRVSRPKQHFTWYNSSVANNTQQQSLVENIFHGTSYPYPYIVFGPPGTGKTTTLVESILQIWTNIKDSRILIVSTSNFACNVISSRLLEFLSSTDIFRLFSKSQELVIDKIDAHVLKVSNLKKKQHYYTTPSELYSYRIIIATLTTSGRLIQDGFSCKHFTHLFIDECGSCTEGASLIPIAGLISSANTIQANIVLAGDPLQLGPVIHSKYAEQLGYGVSMIERLMKLSLYKKDERIGDYNSKFITKLRLNYRSHKDILHISNTLFYENELKALGSKHVTDWVRNWRYLPNPKFPIIFETVFGQSLSDNNSPSLYNKHEIRIVMSYVKLLVNQNINGKLIKQSDIGIITPYRKQSQKIRSQCENLKFKNIEVASVEAFQGNERSVIIFSTVRSNVGTMGFLKSERRLNVALTRAQGLLIIIGDPKVLRKDKCWYQLLKFCYDNGAICGQPFNLYGKN